MRKPRTIEVCARCGYSRKEHKLGNYADGPLIGAEFLVCPAAIYKPEIVTIERKKRAQDGSRP